MKRWHSELSISKRNWSIHRRMHVEDNKRRNILFADPFVVECECDEQIGRFRKKDAYDCGNPRCFICHSDKFPEREITRQETISDISFKEQLEELK